MITETRRYEARLEAGDPVLLVDRKRRSYLLWLREGGSYDLRGGRVAHDAVIGQPEGATVETSRGERLLALRPTLADYVLSMPRGAQVVYPKDLALIVMLADIYPGARVAEAGTGSGALTMALLRAVGPSGRVFSYDIREEFQRTAARNIARYLGEVATLEMRLHDVSTGIPDAPVDRVVLDLPEPWRVAAAAAAALRPGGILLAYVPTTVQVHQVASALTASADFGLVETVEALVRPWHVEGQSVRPAHRMVAHTGFLVTARRVVPPPRPDRPAPAPAAG
ncbi:MAG: tRNA (adenine-N1)-methyltransferase [Armatimonadota bacterium]|nr:tRNA (adenine-N1)-methyltransferase [Armatimonadota bacterium]MDR7454699.1 tRNA (adenine-N1)-methyltransferase [Armatimonadota bacterium]MDR7496784.1 tRNA (adenine-N1)-methyltransferase [Armatimonadota bacterium]MDR7511210.1 tRNA (adenine-N1)-methyltransferase [Armatimonadota bacterium]